MSNASSKKKFVVVHDPHAASVVDTEAEALAIMAAARKTTSGSEVARVFALVDAPQVANCWSVNWKNGAIVSAYDLGPSIVTPNEPGPGPGSIGVWTAYVKADTLDEAVKTATTLAEMARHSTQE